MGGVFKNYKTVAEFNILSISFMLLCELSGVTNFGLSEFSMHEIKYLISAS